MAVIGGGPLFCSSIGVHTYSANELVPLHAIGGLDTETRGERKTVQGLDIVVGLACCKSEPREGEIAS